jgi:hypothetical protein
MPGLYRATGRKGRGLAAALLAVMTLAPAANPARSDERPGVLPVTPWACPASHPIKGYLTEESGLVYYRPGGRFYEEASPTRCYASEEEARRDGARRSPDDEPLRR